MDAEEARRREEVKLVYAGSMSWPEKVDRMTVKQLTALYLKFKTEGRVK